MMIARETQLSVAFGASAELMLQLHRQIAAGRGESSDADEIRDQMDVPWYGMSEVEQKRIRGLSSDLYSIGASRPSVESDSAAIAVNELKQLVANDAWYEILDLIRKFEAALSPRAVAYMRGLCWAHVGQPNIAIEFLNETARLGRLSPSEEILLLSCYVHALRVNEVIARALEIKISDQHPLLLLKAAEILSVAAEGTDAESATDHRRAAVDCAERAFATLKKVQIEGNNQNVLDVLEVPAYLHLSLNYDQLGSHEKALDACRKALEIAPDNPNALMLFGFLTFDGIPKDQRKHFIEQFHDRLSAEEPLALQTNSTIQLTAA